MARQAAAYRTTGIGSVTLPIASLYASSTGGLWLVEVGITNTSTTAYECSLVRLTSAGTQGTAVTPTYEENELNFTAKGDPRQTHTANPGLGTEIRRATIGASAGSGVIWTFGGRGLWIPSGVANGVGLIALVGAAIVSDVYWSWDA